MNVYVAGKFEEKERVRATQKLLREAGFGITCDWTVHSADGLQGQAVLDKLSTEAQADLYGVDAADAFVLLYHPDLQGGLVELGMALGRGIPVVIVGAREAAYVSGNPGCIFYWTPGIHHVRHADEAVEVLDFVRKLGSVAL